MGLAFFLRVSEGFIFLLMHNILAGILEVVVWRLFWIPINVKCGGCVEVCPCFVFEQKDQLDAPKVVRGSLCEECGQCMMRCPVDAVSVPGYSADKIVEVGNLPEPEEATNLLLGRRSVRSFTDQQVDHALLERVIVLAASAPSAHNVRSTEFTIVQNAETLGLLNFTNFVKLNVQKLR